MAQDVELGCRCGEVHGWLRGASPGSVNRAICYCVDCQSFLHNLGRADLFDAHSGTDIVQAAPRSVTYDRGLDRIVAVGSHPRACIAGMRAAARPRSAAPRLRHFPFEAVSRSHRTQREATPRLEAPRRGVAASFLRSRHGRTESSRYHPLAHRAQCAAGQVRPESERQRSLSIRRPRLSPPLHLHAFAEVSGFDARVFA
jgi:hypothetical protein